MFVFVFVVLFDSKVSASRDASHEIVVKLQADESYFELVL